VRILDRYILAEWAKVFALSLLSFMGLLLLSEGYNWIPDFLGWGASFGTILQFMLLGLVKDLSMLIPISLLISVVFTKVLAVAQLTTAVSCGFDRLNEGSPHSLRLKDRNARRRCATWRGHACSKIGRGLALS
jgi:lipopolysaccharide export LptBFGC system permease protein LptF